jgi:hypothetical protein
MVSGVGDFFAKNIQILAMSFEEFVGDDALCNLAFMRVNDAVPIEIKAFRQLVVFLADPAVSVLQHTAQS